MTMEPDDNQNAIDSFLAQKAEFTRSENSSPSSYLAFIKTTYNSNRLYDEKVILEREMWERDYFTSNTSNASEKSMLETDHPTIVSEDHIMDINLTRCAPVQTHINNKFPDKLIDNFTSNLDVDEEDFHYIPSLQNYERGEKTLLLTDFPSSDSENEQEDKDQELHSIVTIEVSSDEDEQIEEEDKQSMSQALLELQLSGFQGGRFHNLGLIGDIIDIDRNNNNTEDFSSLPIEVHPFDL